MNTELLVINIGNTNTQWVKVGNDNEFITQVNTLSTAAWQEDVTLLPQVAEDCQVWVACVVPQAKECLLQKKYYWQLKFVDVDSAERAGVDFSQMESSTLGADRIANAAAMLEYPLPAANFDCGTAITMEVLDENRSFIGGAIMPGRKLMRKSLAQGTAALPEIPLAEIVPDAVGRNTVQAMTLGIDRGAVGMVREMIAVVKTCGVRTLLVSGGDAPFFCKALPELQAAGKDFTLRGIIVIAGKNQQY